MWQQVKWKWFDSKSQSLMRCSRGLNNPKAFGKIPWLNWRWREGGYFGQCSERGFFQRCYFEKLAEKDILSNLRSEFCISKGPGLYEHQRYCDLYLQCNEQGVGVTMECSRMYFYLSNKFTLVLFLQSWSCIQWKEKRVWLSRRF